MCGIIGYIGKKEARPILIDGLKRLEYRGYDSAGIVVLGSKNNPQLIKCKGKIRDLEEKIGNRSINGFLGLGHTRWATHGAPNDINAHPHGDCSKKIFLVHNGIIENYKEIKNILLKRGHKFESETDSEVIVHLVEDFLEKEKNGNNDLEKAFIKALKLLKGAYAIALISKNYPQKILGAKKSSPLILGIGNEESFLVSDTSAILGYAQKVVYLDDEEIVSINPSGFSIFDLKNKIKEKEFFEIENDLIMVQKSGYPHFMLKEIMEQPDSLENSQRGRIILEEGMAKLGGIESAKEKLREIEKLVIVGCGSAYLAGMVGEYMIEEYAGIPTEVEIGSEFRYRKPIFNKKSAVLAISQSGETADTLAAVNEAKEKSVLTIGLVNVVSSTIARQTDVGIYNHAGAEIGVASTKAFTSQVEILALLTLFLGRQRSLSLVMGQRIAKEIKKMPNLAKEVLSRTKEIRNIAKKYYKFKNFLYIGRKYNYPVALEGALKLKEISYINAQGYAAGEMKHGSIALIDKDFPCLAICPRDSVYEKIISNIEEIKARHGQVIAVTTNGNKEIESLVDDVIYIPKTLEMLTPIISVIPLQLFAYYVSSLKGLDPDKPRNLAKSVTVE